MQREANEHIKKIITTIKYVLAQNNMPDTPHNIIKYTTDSIIRLLKNKDSRNVKDLLSILFVFQDFLEGDLTDLLCLLIDNNFEDKAFRILKILFNSGRGDDCYVNLLFSFYLKGIAKSKIYNIVVQYPQEFKTILVSNSFQDKEFLSLTNSFFEVFMPQLEFKSRLDSFIKQIQSTVEDTKVMEDNWKIVLSILYKYGLWLEDFNAIEEFVKSEKTVEDFISEEIVYITSRTKEAGLVKPNLTLRVIGKVIEIDWIYYCKYNSNVFKLDKETKGLIKTVVLKEDTNLKGIEDFFYSVKHTIIPDYIDLVRELCDRYNSDNQDRIRSILKCICCNIGVMEMISIMEEPIDYVKWIPIFSASSNNDIKTFMDIYNRTEEKEKILSMLPAFCNYSTDYYNRIEEFMKIIVGCLMDKMYFTLTCSGLKNLIMSHETNINKTCILKNPIEKESSQRILTFVYQETLFYEILKNFNNEQVPKEVLFLIIRKLNKERMQKDCENLYNYILSYPDHSPITLRGIVVGDIKACLNLTKFFVALCDVPFDLPSKVIELWAIENPQVQKKAYELLYYLEKEGKIEICVCEHINSPDLLTTFKSSSLKYKLLYLNLERPCKKLSFLLQSVILSFNGSISSRRVSEDILDNIFLSSSPKKDVVLDFVKRGITANNLEIVSGSLSTFTYLLQKFSTTIPFETQKDFYAFIVSNYKSINALTIIKSILSFLKHTDGIVDKEIGNILEYFIDAKKKKYRTDIKEVVHVLLQRELPVSRKLKRYTNFRIPTNKQTLTITKNNEIIIGEETK